MAPILAARDYCRTGAAGKIHGNRPLTPATIRAHPVMGTPHSGGVHEAIGLPVTQMETVANTSIPAHRIPMPSQNFAKNSLNMVLLTFLLLGAVDALSGVWKRSQTLLANIFPARRTFRIGALFNPIKGAP